MFGVKHSREERSYDLTDDLSPTGVARLEAIYQNLSTPESAQQSLETSSERELQLQVRLAEIELEREKLQHDLAGNTLPIKERSSVGVPPWRVISQVQRSLGWSDANAAYKLIVNWAMELAANIGFLCGWRGICDVLDCYRRFI